MSFLDTVPAAIQRVDSSGPWARFRVSDPRERAATLREICRGDVPLTLGTAAGPTCSALLWAVDDENERLHFSVAPASQNVGAVVSAPKVWAAGYLGDVKLQFDLPELSIELGGPQPMLRALAPRHMLRLPRRGAMRVRRGEAQAPVASLRLPPASDTVLQMRVVDISMSGCALSRPIGSPAPAPGMEIEKVEVMLDEDAIFVADLRVQHVTLVAASRSGARVGCAWQGLSRRAAETLELWIERGRRRRDLVSLKFD
jgi:c-di-GMP-binding flagellar brake protein YcgR